MSNSPPNAFNLKVTQSAISAPPNGAGITKADPGSPVVQTRNRTISPLTQYNNKSGMVEADPESPWGGQAKPVEAPAEPEKPVEAAPDRRAAWKADQERVKTERAAKQAKSLEERQPLARDFLKKGDLAGAAKALGMTSAEFREYAQNVLLTMPTPDKELTPEQKREADEKKVRDDLAASTKEIETLKYQITASNYIRDKIRPVLADKDAFEFIAKSEEKEPGKIEAYIYNFMDGHFRKTGEELNAKDVAETIEAELERTAASTVEGYRGIKKAAKFLTPKQEEAAERSREVSAGAPQLATEEDVETPPAPAPRPAPRVEERPAPKQAVVRSTPPGDRIPFALLSREERLAAMREEENA